ncbi:MAG: hypothetical protein ACLRWQ_09755 [Flavonifractor plautii]
MTEVTIRSGKEKVTAFGGKSITLYLPVENKAFEVGKSYVVYQISDDGSVEQLVGKCVKTGGKRFLELTTTHLSTLRGAACRGGGYALYGCEGGGLVLRRGGVCLPERYPDRNG